MDITTRWLKSEMSYLRVDGAVVGVRLPTADIHTAVLQRKKHGRQTKRGVVIEHFTPLLAHETNNNTVV